MVYVGVALMVFGMGCAVLGIYLVAASSAGMHF